MTPEQLDERTKRYHAPEATKKRAKKMMAEYHAHCKAIEEETGRKAADVFLEQELFGGVGAVILVDQEHIDEVMASGETEEWAIR